MLIYAILFLTTRKSTKQTEPWSQNGFSRQIIYSGCSLSDFQKLQAKGNLHFELAILGDLDTALSTDTHSTASLEARESYK